MRFPILTKTTLLAASLFVASAAWSHAQTINSTTTGIDLGAGDVTIDTSGGSFTVDGNVSGTGTITVTGGQLLEFLPGVDKTFPSRPIYYNWEPEVHTEGGAVSVLWVVEEGSDALPWTGGELFIKEGTVNLKGFVNTYLNFGPLINSDEALPINGQMVGVDVINLQGSARLEVGDSVFDPAKDSKVPGMIRGSKNVFVLLNNLCAGKNNDQHGTVLDVGRNNRNSKDVVSDTYHVDLHVAAWDGNENSTTTLKNGGSAANIIGDANIYKTGAGNFTLLGENASYTGSFYAAGGNLILKGAGNDSISVDVGGVLAKHGYNLTYGRTLWSAESLTIAGTIDPQDAMGSATSSLSEASRLGADVRYRVLNTQWNPGTRVQVTSYRPAYFATPEAGTVVVGANQAIRNFQAMFANGAAATDSNKSVASAIQNAADNVDKDAPIIAGTGSGSYLAVAKDATLAIFQENGMGGVYKGTICGVNSAGTAAGVNAQTGLLEKGGTIVKYGTGDLALMLEGANYEKLAILEGDDVVVNITAIDLEIGSYNSNKGVWDRETGLLVGEAVKSFTVVENAAATLKMRLETDDVHFSTFAFVTTAGGEVDVSDGRKPGYIELSTEQRFVGGEVFVEGGMTLILTAEDLAGDDIDLDGDKVADQRRYYDINGEGTFKAADGKTYSVNYYKDLSTGKRVYYYVDASGVEMRLSESDVNSENFRFTDAYEFSGGSVANAKAVILAGQLGEESEAKSVRSTLAFNGTNQVVNNLTGDVYSGVQLGTSTLTLNITDAASLSGATANGDSLAYSTYLGSISGVGNIVKTGAEKLTLGGGSSLSYMGATVLAEGSIDATRSQSLWNSSAVIMNSGTEFTLAGAQNWVALVGAENTKVTLDNGELRLGMDASRRNDLGSALQAGGEVPGIIVTNRLGNSLDVLDTFAERGGDFVAAYLKPLLDFTGKEITYTDADGNTQTRTVLSQSEATSLKNYFQGNTFNDNDMRSLFGHSVARGTLTVADITRLYARLTAETQFGAEFDTSGALKGDLTEMIDRLSFGGTLTANSIRKIGNDRATLSGKLEAKSAVISGGVLEIDADVAASEATFKDGISVAAGATFSINTSGVEGAYSFDKIVSGDGNFEKIGEGHLVLTDNVAYLGTTTLAGGDLTMSIRAVENSAFGQGDIFVTSAGSTLILNQSEADVVWDGTLDNAGSLVKSGEGTLTLTSGAKIGRNLTVEAGTLVLANAELADAVGVTTLSVADGASLNLSESGDASIDRLFCGSGTIVKSGAGALTLETSSFGKEPEKFAGKIRVEAGSLTWATDDMFANSVAVNVAEDAVLNVNANQTVKMLTGDGVVDIRTDKSVALTLALDNENTLSYDKSAGVYVTTVNGRLGTDYSAFDAYSGTIRTSSELAKSQFAVAGTGSIVFAGEVTSDKIALSVGENATLITSNLGLSFDLQENARVILASDAEDAEFTGTLSGKLGRVIGKIGSGTVTLAAKQSTTWSNAALEVLEGTLRLKGSAAFTFASAVIAEGATLSLDYTGDESNPDFSTIEGSGTIKLETGDNLVDNNLNLTASSMLGPIPNAEGKYFNGILDAGTSNINVYGEGITLCAIATKGDFFADSKVTIYQGKDTTIEGVFSGNIELSGNGVLTLASEDVTGTILVNNGKVVLNANAKTLNNDVGSGVRVKNNATIAFTETSSFKDMLSGVEVRLAQGDKVSVGRIELIKTGDDNKALDFMASADGGQKKLNVSDELWTATTGENRGNAQLVLGVNQGELALSGLADLDKAVALSTQSAGTLAVLAEDVAETLDRSISGDGEVAFRGAKGTTIAVNQAYTGATTIEDGALVTASNVALATSDLVVEKDGTLKGGIKLVGKPVAAAKAVAASGEKAAPTEGGNFVNNGTVVLNVNNGDMIEYAGTFANTGTIQITGARAATRGHEIVLFKSLQGTTYSTQEMEVLFGGGKLTNGATALMLSQTESGVISAFSVGSSLASVSGLHDGLAGSYTDVLDMMSGVDDAQDGIVFESDLQTKWGEIGVALNRASADSLADDVANLSPIGMASMVAMARTSFMNDWNMLSDRMSHRRYDSGNTLMENGPEFFANARASLVDNPTKSDAANFDFNTYGAVVGMDVKPDDYSVYGFALGYDYGSAKLHNSGGDIHSDSFRATAFAGGLLGDGTLFLDGAVHVGMNSYEVDRKTLVGEVEGDTDGWNFGAAMTFGKGFLLSKDANSRLLVTPYVDMAYLYTRVDAFSESGTAALDVDAFNAHSLRGRLGATLDWQFPLGEWDARVSLDVAYSHEFLDEEAEIEAAFAANDEQFRVDGLIGSSDAFSISPSMTIDLSERDSLSFGYTLEYGTDEQVSHSFNAGFRHCF